MVEDHTEDVANFQREVDNGKDPDVCVDPTIGIEHEARTYLNIPSPLDPKNSRKNAKFLTQLKSF